ncbi:MAG: RIO1 family regulatory kinase/ATPase [Ignavibacteria bacterium]
MKITLEQIDVFEDDTSFEKFKSRKRKLSGSQNINKLVSGDGTNSFTASDLEDLRGRAIVDELLHVIKSGKEATVYLGKSSEGYSAVKIYTDLRVRSFKRDDIYRQGRFIGDARIEKAIDQGSKTGLNAHQILWVAEEFRQMKYLYNSGIPVPKPIANSGLVVVMEFIGEEGDAAPRISDLKLDRDEAEDCFRQSVKILEKIISAGRIHGDYSSYNLLLHDEKVILIDFPQVIEIQSNVSSKDILKRDIVSLCKSFKRHKVVADPEKIYRNMVNIIYDSGIDL